MTAIATGQVRTPSPYRLTLFRTVRGEWIKLATLRSTWWSIGIVTVITIGIAVLIANAMNTPGFTGIHAVVAPIQFTMLLAGILGVISVTGEYSTGMIRSTLAADPVRGSVLASKAIVVALLMLVSSLVTFFVAALIVSPIVAGKGLPIAWGDFADTVLPLLAASAAMAVFALIGVAFGFVIRSGAGAIAATVGLLFVLPIVMTIFASFGSDWQWVYDLSDYLPMSAAQSVISPVEGAAVGPEVAAATLAGWVVVGMLGSWAVLRTRDA